MVGSILLVDDDPVLREVLGEALNRLGHDVHGAACGEDAIQLMRRRPFDGALIDYELPDMTGVALFYIIKSYRIRLAQSTVFISGHNGIRFLLPKHAPFLEKPFSTADADQALAHLLTRTAVK